MINKKGIQETRHIAVETINLLQQAEVELKKARNWGVYDLLGGGFFASMIKHRRVDRAERLLRNVRFKLEQLQRKLNQVHLSFTSGVNITEVERFIDIAFDNIITDWMVQSKIKSSLKQVQNIKSDIEKIIVTLDDLASKST